MSLLEHPQAQALLNDATVSANTVRGCTDRLSDFLRRYLPRFYRIEQRDNATRAVRAVVVREADTRGSARPDAIDLRPRLPLGVFRLDMDTRLAIDPTEDVSAA
jgi:hypothetical protein